MRKDFLNHCEPVENLTVQEILEALRICATDGACGTCPAFLLADQRKSHINAVMLEAARHIEELNKRLMETEGAKHEAKD